MSFRQDANRLKNLPLKRTHAIDGCNITYTVAGQGTPTIVLINGAGGPLEGWYKLYPEVEALGTVVAYNRPGIGGSSRPLVPETGEVVVHTLHRLLKEIDAHAPYVLVGHSFGGLHANLFARLYPKEVGGVILLDATAPDDVVSMKAYQSPWQRLISRVMRRMFGFDPNNEINNEEHTVKQISQAPTFPNVPLQVISGGQIKGLPSEAINKRAQNQATLSRLSPQGHHTIAAQSGHFPQMTEPTLVLDIIARVIASVREQEIIQ